MAIAVEKGIIEVVVRYVVFRIIALHLNVFDLVSDLMTLVIRNLEIPT